MKLLVWCAALFGACPWTNKQGDGGADDDSSSASSASGASSADGADGPDGADGADGADDDGGAGDDDGADEVDDGAAAVANDVDDDIDGDADDDVDDDAPLDNGKRCAWTGDEGGGLDVGGSCSVQVGAPWLVPPALPRT